MAILTAPAEKTFTTVPTGTYAASVIAVKPLDFTVNPDQFGNKGHWSLEFRWQLETEQDADGWSVELPHTLKFQTGSWVAKQGQRVGHMPWLTEYTRAFGLPDIEAGERFDTDTLIGKRAMLTIVEDRQEGGSVRNKITAIGPVHGRAPRPTMQARPQPKPAVPQVENTGIDDGDVPF